MPTAHRRLYDTFRHPQAGTLQPLLPVAYNPPMGLLMATLFSTVSWVWGGGADRPSDCPKGSLSHRGLPCQQ